MPISVNCQHFRYGGHCTHQAAPRRLWGLPQCVLMHPPADPRLSGCNLVWPHAKPDGYPLPPPSVVRRECSKQGRTVSPIVEPDRPWPRASTGEPDGL